MQISVSLSTGHHEISRETESVVTSLSHTEYKGIKFKHQEIRLLEPFKRSLNLLKTAEHSEG